MKKFIALFLCILMTVCALPLTAFAEGEIIASGECGVTEGTVFWELDEEYTLTVSGTGDMEDYSTSGTAPWISASLINGNSRIKKIVVGEGVTSIGNYAFDPVYHVISTELPSTVTKIGNHAFASCSALSSINLPVGLTSIGEYAFNGCSKLDVTIPETVTSIGVSAFFYCTALTSVTVPEGVTVLEKEVFSYCTNLTSVTLPESLTTIGERAFKNCSKLTAITIPENTTKIDSDAFNSCSSLKTIHIPASVTYLPGGFGAGVFNYCSSLESITVAEDNPNFYSKNNCLIQKSSGAILYGCKNSIIPDDASVKYIYDYAFTGCSGLTSIDIPENIVSVGRSSFEDCGKLASITVTDKVEFMSRDTFLNTAYYKNSENWSDGLLYVGNHLIAAKQTLSGVITIPEGTVGIAGYGFGYCSQITGLIFPESLNYLGYDSLYGCTALKMLVMPHTVHHSNTLGQNVRIATVCFGGTQTEWNTFVNSMFKGVFTNTTVYYGHNFTSTETPASCLVAGALTKTCSACGKVVVEEIEALGHDYIDHEAKAAGCTEIGWNAYKTCSRCDYTTYSEIEALGHDYINHEAKAATCTEIGWNAYETCKNCDYTTYSEISAKGHNIVKHEAKAPSCTEVGWNAYENCTDCNYSTYSEIAVTEHNDSDGDGYCDSCSAKMPKDKFDFIDKFAQFLIKVIKYIKEVTNSVKSWLKR